MKDVDEVEALLVSRVVGGQDEVLLPMTGGALHAMVGAVDVDTETVEEAANVSPRRPLLPEVYLKTSIADISNTLCQQMCACHVDSLSLCATIRSASTFDLLVSPD